MEQLARLSAVIQDDGYAATFQSFGQYRAALQQHIANVLAVPAHVLHHEPESIMNQATQPAHAVHPAAQDQFTLDGAEFDREAAEAFAQALIALGWHNDDVDCVGPLYGLLANLLVVHCGQPAEKAGGLSLPHGCFGVSCDTQSKTVTLRFDTWEQAIEFYRVTGPAPSSDSPAAMGAAVQWTSVKDGLPETDNECTARDLNVSATFFVRGIDVTGGQGCGLADYQEDGKWHCYGGDHDFMHIVEVTHYLPVRPTASGAVDLHTDDLAIDRFALAMKARMAEMRSRGKKGWDDPKKCPLSRLIGLMDSVPAGQPVDVGNYAMMLFNRAVMENTPRPTANGAAGQKGGA